MESRVEVELAALVTQAGITDERIASLREARRAFERRYILAVLELNQWRVGATARALGLQRPNLYRKARQLSIALKPAAEAPAA